MLISKWSLVTYTWGKNEKCLWLTTLRSERSLSALQTSIQVLSPLLPLSLRRERFTLGISPLPQDKWRSGKYFIVIGMLARQILVCSPKNHLKAIMRFINSCYAEGLTGVVNQCWKRRVDCSRPLYFSTHAKEKASMKGLWTRKRANATSSPEFFPTSYPRLRFCAGAQFSLPGVQWSIIDRLKFWENRGVDSQNAELNKTFKLHWSHLSRICADRILNKGNKRKYIDTQKQIG